MNVCGAVCVRLHFVHACVCVQVYVCVCVCVPTGMHFGSSCVHYTDYVNESWECP